MVLHGDRRQATLGSPLFGPLGREIAGMQIVDHGCGLNFKGAHQVVKRLTEKLEPGEIFKVAQVLALVDETAARERKHIFQVSANGQQRWRIQWQRNAEWNKAARAADRCV